MDIPQIVRKTIRDVGYTRAKYGFDSETCAVLTAIDEQSTDIAMGVNKSLETKKSCGTSKVDMGAGDQGMMFGYAVDETPEYMPLPISLAHEITRKLAQVRKNEKIPYLLPDGKSQVTVEYKDGKPIRVDTVVVSAQHSPDVEYETLRGHY